MPFLLTAGTTRKFFIIQLNAQNVVIIFSTSDVHHSLISNSRNDTRDFDWSQSLLVREKFEFRLLLLRLLLPGLLFLREIQFIACCCGFALDILVDCCRDASQTRASSIAFWNELPLALSNCSRVQLSLIPRINWECNYCVCKPFGTFTFTFAVTSEFAIKDTTLT